MNIRVVDVHTRDPALFGKRCEQCGQERDIVEVVRKEDLDGEVPEQVLTVCQDCADVARYEMRLK